MAENLDAGYLSRKGWEKNEEMGIASEAGANHPWHETTLEDQPDGTVQKFGIDNDAGISVPLDTYQNFTDVGNAPPEALAGGTGTDTDFSKPIKITPSGLTEEAAFEKANFNGLTNVRSEGGRWFATDAEHGEVIMGRAVGGDGKDGDLETRTLRPGEEIDNGDGTFSSEVSITITNERINDGKPTNIPSIYMVDGKVVRGDLNDEESAVDRALATGQEFKAFESIPEAEAAAKARSDAGGANADKPDSVASTITRGIADFGQAIESVPSGITRGLVNFGANVIGATGLVDQKDIDKFTAAIEEINEVATEGNPVAKVGGFVGEIGGQFVAPAVGLYKAALPVAQFLRAGKASPLVASIVSEAAVGLFGLSPNEENLFNMIPEDSEAFGAIRDLLATDPEGGEWENRSKNAAEALIMLGAGEAAVRGLIKVIGAAKKIELSVIPAMLYGAVDAAADRLSTEAEQGITRVYGGGPDTDEVLTALKPMADAMRGTDQHVLDIERQARVTEAVTISELEVKEITNAHRGLHIKKQKRSNYRKLWKKSGITEDEITAYVNKEKARHPKSAGWTGWEFGKVIFDVDDAGIVKAKILPKEQPYTYQLDANGKTIEKGTAEYTAHVENVAQKMFDDVMDVHARKMTGKDKNAEAIMRQAGWYKNMRDRIRKEFGGMGDLFADLLGATSPNTPVRDNWKNSVEALRRYTNGDYDELIPKWSEWAENVDKLEAELLDLVNKELSKGEPLKVIKESPEYTQIAEPMAAKVSDAVAKAVEKVKASDDYAALTADIKAITNGQSGKDLEKVKNGRKYKKAFAARAALVKDTQVKARDAVRESGDYVQMKGDLDLLVQSRVTPSKKAVKETEEYIELLEKVKEAKILPEDLLPKKENGNNFGFNGRNAVRAFEDMWRIIKEKNADIGRGGTKPKALNFSGNLIGFRDRATIDVWAARMLERLTKGHKIPSAAEGGVKGDMLPSGDTTGQFAMGQDIFTEARKLLNAEGVKIKDKDLAKLNDDDLQAISWFVEKEQWAKADSTSAAGEGGSFEFEADLTGTAAQEQVTELRRIIDSTLSDPEERAAAVEKLNMLHRTVDRFTAGVSIQKSGDIQNVDFVPNDADQAAVSARIKDSIYTQDKEAKVLGSKVMSTEGRYGGVERSFDMEIVAREGYDITNTRNEIFKIAKENGQDSAFISRVLRDDETPDFALHRPGMEVYFKDMGAVEKLQPMLDSLAKEGLEFYTVVVDARRGASATSGEMPNAVGVRIMSLPELDARYDINSLPKSHELHGVKVKDMTDEQLAEYVEASHDSLSDIADRIANNIDGTTSANVNWYDVETRFEGEYDAKPNRVTGEAGSPDAGSQWRGRSVNEARDAAIGRSQGTGGATGNGGLSGQSSGIFGGGDAGAASLAATPFAGLGLEGLDEPEPDRSGDFQVASSSSRIVKALFGEPTGISKKAVKPVRGEEQLLESERYSDYKVGDPDALEEIDFNFQNLNTDDDVKQLMDVVSDEYAAETLEATGGVISHQTTNDLSTLLGVDPDRVADVVESLPGQTQDLHVKALTMRKVLVASAEHTDNLAKAVRDAPAGESTDKQLLEFREQLIRHSQLQTQFKGVQTDIARALSAFRIAADPNFARNQAQQNMDEIIEALGGRGTTEEIADRWLRTPVDRRPEFAARSAWAKSKDMVYETWINGLLSGLRTHEVNILSNAVFTLWQIPERALAASIGSVFRNPARVRWGEVLALFHGMAEGVGDGFRLAGTTWKNEMPSDGLSKIEAQQMKAITAQNAGIDPASIIGRGVDLLGQAIRIPGRALMTMDELGKSIGYRGELRAVSLRKMLEARDTGKMSEHILDLSRVIPESSGAEATRLTELREAADAGPLSKSQMDEVYGLSLKYPTEELETISKDFANSVTFTTELGETGRKGQQFVRAIPGAGVVVPFIRTPTNVIKEFGKRNPVFAAMMPSVYKDFHAGGARRQLAMAKIGLGAATMALAGKWALDGFITGGGPEDWDQRRVWLETHKPYSMKIGGEWVPYGRIEPIAMLFGSTADAVEIAAYAGDDVEMDAIYMSVMAGTVKNVGDKSFLRGIADVNNVYQDPKRYTESYLARLATSTMPYSSQMRDVKRAIDPTMHETRADPNLPPVNKFFQRVANEFKAAYPGFNNDLPPKRTFWGEKRTAYEGGAGHSFNAFRTYKIKHSKIDDAITALNDGGIAMPPRKIGSIKLDWHQYDKLIVAMNKSPVDLLDPDLIDTYGTNTMRQAMSGLVEGLAWNLLAGDTEGQKGLLIGIRNDFVDAAKKSLAMDDSKLAEALMNETTERAIAKEMRDAASDAAESGASVPRQ
jgi:hypothetical protein